MIAAEKDKMNKLAVNVDASAICRVKTGQFLVSLLHRNLTKTRLGDVASSYQ